MSALTPSELARLQEIEREYERIRVKPDDPRIMALALHCEQAMYPDIGPRIGLYEIRRATAALAWFDAQNGGALPADREGAR